MTNYRKEELSLFFPLPASVRDICSQWVRIASLLGSTLHAADIGARTGLNIVGVRQGNELVSPGPDTALMTGATLLAIGTPEQRRAFKKTFGS